jgi:outer membrane biogenesis lipoprotein LolB
MTRHHLLLAAASALILATAACQGQKADNQLGAAQTEGSETDGLAKLATIEMKVDTSYLSAEERQVVNLLNQAALLMSEIYKRQAT